jgi:hypothetical protein
MVNGTERLNRFKNGNFSLAAKEFLSAVSHAVSRYQCSRHMLVINCLIENPRRANGIR